MSDSSFNKVQSEILKTVASFDGESFIPYGDFGMITVDPSFADLEDKYRVSIYLY